MNRLPVPVFKKRNEFFLKIGKQVQAGSPKDRA